MINSLHAFFFLFLTFFFNAFALEVGGEAPCAPLTTVYPDGNQKTECVGERSSHHQFTYLEFSSITCMACQQNLPLVQQLFRELSESTSFRLVYIDRNIPVVLNYLSQNSSLINFPVALDGQREAKRLFNVQFTPTHFIFDQNKRIIYKHIGLLNLEEMAKIKHLLKN